MKTKVQDIFLQLVRIGIGHEFNIQFESVDWKLIKNLAERHGLTAVVLDGIDNASLNSQIPLELKLQWIGEVLQDYEGRYKDYGKAIGEMAGFYNCHGYKMMVLKGYACSLDWPRPNHRPCGDIDIWQFGKQKDADSLLASIKGVALDSSLPHHTVFYWDNFMVENHFDFLNVRYGHRNDEMEVLLKEQAMDDSHSIVIDGQKVYLPNANLHALFLLRHSMLNFAATEITLRQVLDWAFFVEKHSKEINWKWLFEILKEYKMMNFFNTISAICVDDLGFSSSSYPSIQFLPDMKDRVLADILSPEFSGNTPLNIFTRAFFKMRRWQANAWKQDMCYGDNRSRSFLEGVWSHLLKPATI